MLQQLKVALAVGIVEIGFERSRLLLKQNKRAEHRFQHRNFGKPQNLTHIAMRVFRIKSFSGGERVNYKD